MTASPNIESKPVERPSTAVLSALAAHENCSPLDIDTPLFEVVDSDAMDKLFHDFGQPDARPVSVSFSMLDYEVELHGDGRVYVDGEQYLPGDDGVSAGNPADV